MYVELNCKINYMELSESSGNFWTEYKTSHSLMCETASAALLAVVCRSMGNTKLLGKYCEKLVHIGH